MENLKVCKHANYTFTFLREVSDKIPCLVLQEKDNNHNYSHSSGGEGRKGTHGWV